MGFSDFSSTETHENNFSQEHVTLPQQITVPQPVKEDNKSKEPPGLGSRYIIFLNGNVQTILATSVAVAIGYSFQNLVNATITCLIQPLIIKLLLLTRINDIYDFASFISPEKSSVNFTLFISNIISFIICIITVYFLNNLFQIKK